MDALTLTPADLLDIFRQGVRAGSTSSPSDWFVDYLQGESSDSGLRINRESAMSYSSVFAAVSMIAGDIAGLPLNVYALEEDGDSHVERTHPAQWLLNDEPNDLMTAYTLREIMQSHCLLHGNAYAAIQRDGAGRPKQLIPLLPDRVKVQYSQGVLTYSVRDENDHEIHLSGRDVFHVKGLGYDGLSGYSVLTMARNSWGLGLSTEKHGSAHFKNNARPGIVLETESRLTEEQANQLLERWEQRHQGVQEGSKPALLTNGIKISPLAISNEDSQWLESRKFQRVEVAAWFSLPPHKLGDDSRLSYNSIEAENRDYLNRTLTKWLRKWEAEANCKLLTTRARRSGSHWVKHDTKPLIALDMKTVSEIMYNGIAARVFTPNEGRVALGHQQSKDPVANELANPYTTSPGSGETPQDPPPPDNRIPSHVLASAESLLLEHFERVAAIEAKKVLDCGKKADALKRIEDAYGLIEEKLAGAISGPLDHWNILSGTNHDAAKVAADYCEESKQSILKRAGAAIDDSQLKSELQSVVDSWTGRPSRVVSSLTRGRE